MIHRIQCGNVWKKQFQKSQKYQKSSFLYILMGIEVISAIPESANDGFAMAIDGVWEGLQATPRLHGRLHLRKAMKGCGEAQFFFTDLRISQNGSIQHHVTNVGWCWQVKPGETSDFVIWTYFYTFWCCKWLVSCIIITEICMLAAVSMLDLWNPGDVASFWGGCHMRHLQWLMITYQWQRSPPRSELLSSDSSDSGAIWSRGSLVSVCFRVSHESMRIRSEKVFHNWVTPVPDNMPTSGISLKPIVRVLFIFVPQTAFSMTARYREISQVSDRLGATWWRWTWLPWWRLGSGTSYNFWMPQPQDVNWTSSGVAFHIWNILKLWNDSIGRNMSKRFILVI